MAAKDKRGKVRDGLYGGSEDRLKNPFEEDDQIVLAMNSVAVSVMKRGIRSFGGTCERGNATAVLEAAMAV